MNAPIRQTTSADTGNAAKGPVRTTNSDSGAGSAVVALADRPRRVRARRGEGDRLRDEILDVVEQLLVESGNADTVSIRAVSALVGVTAPSIYRHFEDKDAMVHAACERAFERFDQYLLDSSAHATNALEVIHARALAYLQFAVANPGQYRVLFMTPDSHRHDKTTAFDAERSEMKGVVNIAEAIREAIETGLVQKHADPMEMAIMLWSMVHGIASLRIAMSDVPWPDVEHQADMLFTMLANGLCTEHSRELLGDPC